MRKQTIGVIGNAARPGVVLPESLLAMAYEVGRLIGQSGAVLVSGGTGGVMEASAHGAQDAGGLTVGFLPYAEAERSNPYIDLVFPTGMGTMRNFLTGRCCDVLVMVGGGVGTLNELTTAYDVGTPVVALRGSGGWADRIGGALIEGRWLDERKTSELLFASSPAQTVELALTLVGTPRRTGGLKAYTGAAGE